MTNLFLDPEVLVPANIPEKVYVEALNGDQIQLKINV